MKGWLKGFVANGSVYYCCEHLKLWEMHDVACAKPHGEVFATMLTCSQLPDEKIGMSSSRWRLA
jgi:hypothetical protein